MRHLSQLSKGRWIEESSRECLPISSVAVDARSKFESGAMASCFAAKNMESSGVSSWMPCNVQKIPHTIRRAKIRVPVENMHEVRPQHAITSLAYAPDGESILTGSLDATAQVWDIQAGTVLKTFAEPCEGNC